MFLEVEEGGQDLDEDAVKVYWASEASPTLGCSIEISRDICRLFVCLPYVKLTV